MTRTQLLLRSLFFYWRTNLAVLLGVIAGTAVIGGALVVGDSVRGSLRQMTLDRLGAIDHVLTGHRFFREELAGELAARPEFAQQFDAIAPALVLQGGLTYRVSPGSDSTPDKKAAHEAGRGQILVAGQVNVYGLDDRLWTLLDHREVAVPGEGEIVLNRRVAEQLRDEGGRRDIGVQVGDDVTLAVELPASIPRDSLLGKREQFSREITLKVAAILEDEAGVARLNLNPNQQLPANAFVALDTLQQNLDLAAVAATRRNPVATPARVNALFVTAKSADDGAGAQAPEAAGALNTLLAKTWTLEDLRLRVVPNEQFGYLSLESEQQILEDTAAEAGQRAAKTLGVATSPVLVYLANEIRKEGIEKPVSMYSVVAGLDLPLEPPFGPFEFVGDRPELPLGTGNVAAGGTGEILLNEWLAKDIEAQVGDRVSLRYHVVGSHGELPEEERTFVVKGILKLEETPAADRGLVPEVKGITDVESLDDWDQPFPMKLPVPIRDEDYWDAYRATPKAFVTLEAAQSLWQSRYGSLTSLRVAPIPGKSLEESAQLFTRELLAAIDPADAAMAFQPVKSTGLQAASGTTDFSGLFIGFSFFLILSAMILIGLLFRLGLEQRGGSVGLLSAVGLTPKQVRRLFLAEGFIVVVAGGLLGSLAAVGYASLMVHGLKTWWIGAIGTRFLDVYVTPASVVTGFAISVCVAGLAVWWGLRQLRSLSSRELLAGSTEKELTEEGQRRRGRFAAKVAGGAAIVAGLLLIGALTDLVPASEAFAGFSWQVVAFFLIGVLLLTASLAFLSWWLDSDRSAAVRGAGAAGMGRLGLRNASRHRQRSVLTAGLIASATFVIVAVAAGQRNPAVERPDRNSGNGGFTLVAESSTPILYDLNTEAGRRQLDIAPNELFKRMKVTSFRVKPGEDASCLNIYRTQLPTILGVPPAMIERGGFKFVGAREENPWILLTKKSSEGRIPVFGDMNTLQYSLKKGVGDTVEVPDAAGAGAAATLEIAGMFDGSVFQGVLVMHEGEFLRLFPDRAGYQYFLIEIPPEEAGELSQRLESELADYGFDADRVADRLADFLAVQNTYLSTFQTLGGLGLLLGTLGLATVMLRNVLERRSELALLRAVGFRNTGVAWLVLWENAFLLLWGLTAGTVSALLAMAPHLTTVGADVPWDGVLLILGGVFVVGMAAALAAVAAAVRTPILATLRSE